MSNEFDALVSHLYVVGGRAVSAPPPGALVQLAPHRAPRSRERDAFFALVLPAGVHQAKAMFYEQMARLAAERYFANDGAVTVSLRNVMISINEDLQRHNQTHPQQPFYADLVCMVLRQHELYVARTGSGAVLLWQDGTLNTVPSELPAQGVSHGQPLGKTPEPDIKMSRFNVDTGHVVAMTGPNLLQLPQDALASAGARGDVQATINRLKSHGLKNANALVMQFIPPDMPTPQAEAAALTTAPPASSTVPQTTRDETSPQAAVEPHEPRRRFWQRRQTVPEQVAASSHVGPAGTRASEQAKSSSTGRARGLFRSSRPQRDLLVDAAVGARPALDKVQAESRNVFARLARLFLGMLQRLILKLAAGLAALRRILDRILPEPEPGKPPVLPTPLAAAAAILIPVAVVLLVVMVSLNTRDETAFEHCLSQAQIALGVAEDIRTNGGENEQEAWFGVLEVANRCLPRRPEDPLMLEIRDTAQARLDEFAKVVRCPMVPLRRFEPGADLRGPILRNGVDLYTLDVERSILYRDTLNEVGNALISEGDVIVQRGEAIGDVTIRNLVDIEWLTEGSVARGSVLIALDKRGVLVTYSPTFPPAMAHQLVGADRWIDPEAIATWQGKLYILDPPANQVWRYQPSGGTFPSAPEEYFVGDVRPDLTNAVDIAIDQTGNVFILNEDGTLLKYYSGEPQFFQFSALSNGGVGSLGSANAMYLDTGLISPGFYILDKVTQTFHETTLGGTRIQSYRAPSGTSFRDLSGLAVDASA